MDGFILLAAQTDKSIKMHAHDSVFRPFITFSLLVHGMEMRFGQISENVLCSRLCCNPAKYSITDFSVYAVRAPTSKQWMHFSYQMRSFQLNLFTFQFENNNGQWLTDWLLHSINILVIDVPECCQYLSAASALLTQMYSILWLSIFRIIWETKIYSGSLRTT